MPGTPNSARAFLQSQGVKPEYFAGAAYGIEPVVKVVEDLLSRISGLALDKEIGDFVLQYCEPIVAAPSIVVESGAAANAERIDKLKWSIARACTGASTEVFDAASNALSELIQMALAAPAISLTDGGAAEIVGYQSVELADISAIITWLHAQNKPMGELLRRFFNDATRGKVIKEYSGIDPLPTAPASNGN